MGFDDLKTFEGRTYSGMRVGGAHAWRYPDGVWREEKVAPDRWRFSFASLKECEEEFAGTGGALPGTQYHWFVLAHQRVKKLDADAYATYMEGLKYKVGHRRPYWKRWSTDYPDQPDERERLVEILEDALARLRRGDEDALARGDTALAFEAASRRREARRGVRPSHPGVRASNAGEKEAGAPVRPRQGRG